MEGDVTPFIIGGPYPAESIGVIPVPAIVGAKIAAYSPGLPYIAPSGMVEPLPVGRELVVKIAEADPKIALCGGRQGGRNQRDWTQHNGGCEQFDGEFAR